MASTSSAASLLLLFNILFFTMVTSTYVPCPPPPKPKAPKTPEAPKTPKAPKIPPSTPQTPPSTPPKTPSTPPTPPSTGGKATCPTDTLKLGVCADLLGDLVHLVLGTPDKTPCCSLLGGLADLDAAVCLCTAIKANVLGINLNVPVSLSLLLNYCGKKSPSGFKCE